MPEALQTAGECIPARTRLDDADKGMIVFLASKGRTQTEIAQQLGCDQSSVSRWLKKCQPTTDLAKLRAHGLALATVESLNRSAKNAETDGKSGPHALLLEIAGLIKADTQGHTTIILGGDVRDLALISPSQPGLSPSLSDDIHRLTADNPGS